MRKVRFPIDVPVETFAGITRLSVSEDGFWVRISQDWLENKQTIEMLNPDEMDALCASWLAFRAQQRKAGGDA